MYDSVLNEY